MKAALTSLFALVLAVPAFAQQPMPVPNPYLAPYSVPAMAPMLPFPIPFQAAPARPGKPYTMRRNITPQEKRQMMQLAIPLMSTVLNMNMADAMNYLATKYRAKEGLSFQDVVDSMMLRANQLNFKHVGTNQMWKDFQVVLEDTEAPRIEVFSFCDIAVGRDLLKVAPEFIVFLPCRIAVMEDGDKNIWVLMLDWDVTWLGDFRQRMGIPDELYAGALDIRSKMDEIMRAAANGDL